MKAQWGDTIQVRYDLFVEDNGVRADVESELMLRPGPTPTALVNALIGVERNEERWVHLLSWQVWGHSDYPKDIPANCPVSYRFVVTGVTANPIEPSEATGGSVAARMRRVDPTLSERYRQRAGQ
ncbi:MAG: hypothetical protein QM758_26020 [Armatimonas sp.]